MRAGPTGRYLLQPVADEVTVRYKSTPTNTTTGGGHPQIEAAPSAPPGMDRYAAVVEGMDPAEGERLDAELAVTDDALVKAFALGPGGEIPPHEHPGSTNVLQVTEGEVVVTVDGEERRASAPATVVAERGAVHGAENVGDGRAVLTATFAPAP